jgi:hypothetical protein
VLGDSYGTNPTARYSPGVHRNDSNNSAFGGEHVRLRRHHSNLIRCHSDSIPNSSDWIVSITY